jgi:hypothetical protein
MIIIIHRCTLLALLLRLGASYKYLLKATWIRSLHSMAAAAKPLHCVSGETPVAVAKPSLVVFDLDACVWLPEMYQLWGGGGAPFSYRDAENCCVDAAGTPVVLLGAVPEASTRITMNAISSYRQGVS